MEENCFLYMYAWPIGIDDKEKYKEYNDKMTQVTLRRSISHIGVLQIAIIVLTVITALVHLQKGLSMVGGGGGGARPSGPPPGARPGGGGGGGGSSIMSMLP